MTKQVKARVATGFDFDKQLLAGARVVPLAREAGATKLSGKRPLRHAPC